VIIRLDPQSTGLVTKAIMRAPPLEQGQFGHGCSAGTRQERRVGIPAYDSDAGNKKGRHVILSALRPK
jgi:hypothetical protein